MKERYIRQVKKALRVPRRRKAEIVRDLDEIFASAMEHGETEQQVIGRLGTPREFADRAAAQFGVDAAALRMQKRLISIGIALAAAAAAFALYAAAKAAAIPDGVIGQADARTNIQIAGAFGFEALPVVFALGVAAAAFAAVQIVRAVRGRRET